MSVKQQAAATLATYRLDGALYYNKFGQQNEQSSKTGKFTIFNFKEGS
jgi:hypothetical protein